MDSKRESCMPAPYSVELRERAVAAYLDGDGTIEEVAGLFQIGPASLKRWIWLFRKQGDLEPKPHGGGADPRVDDKGLEILKKLVEAAPDASLDEICARYCRRRRTSLSVSTIGRAIRRRLGLVRKKSPTEPRNATRQRSNGAGESTRSKRRHFPSSS